MFFWPQVSERVVNGGLETLVALRHASFSNPAVEVVNRRFNSSDSLAGQ